MDDYKPTPEEEKAMLASIKQRPSRYNAKTIGSVVRRLMTQKGYGQTNAVEAIHEQWAKAVGSTLAPLTRPGNVSRGVLIVHAANSTAMQELNFEKKRVLKQLQQALPEMNIKDIRTRVASLN